MEALTEREAIETITSHFQALVSLVPLRSIRSERDYDKAVSAMNQLLDAGAANEKHPLADLVGTLGALIAEYDDEHHPLEKLAPVEMVRFLMEQHRLSQSEVPEIGSQGVVSEILSGKRELNTRQIKALAERFKLPPGTFL